MSTYLWDATEKEWLPADQVVGRRMATELDKRSNLAFPYIRGDLPPYRSPVTGKIIEGRAARREDLARTGCREVDPSEYKPVYKNYEFCQKHRLPYMGADVPPPMTKDEKMAAKERRAKDRAAEKAALAGPEQPVEYTRGKAVVAGTVKP